jgi:hypothetical protein
MKDEELPLLPGERRVRFGCGALAGLVLGISWAMRMIVGTVETVLLIVGCALVMGVAAALFGERFWDFLRRDKD